MATGNLKNFKGKISNVVGYQLNGQQRLRSMPGKVRQTAATRQSGRLFGRASKIGAAYRHLLVQFIPRPADLQMQTRLSSSIYKWLIERSAKAPVISDHLPFIEGYQFTDEGYTLAERFRVPLQITHPQDGIVQINIPPFVPVHSIISPPETASVECAIASVNCMINHPEKSGLASTVLTFDYNDIPVKEQTISLELPTPAGSLLITAVFLKYLISTHQGLKPTDLKGFRPASIVSAMSL